MAGNSVVIELQKLASESSTEIADLLRKALLVAKKLGITDFEKWVNHELNGYKDLDDLPDYRTTRAQIRGLNPVNGQWVPFLFGEHKDLDEALSTSHIFQSISSLVDCVQTNEKGGSLQSRLPPKIESDLMKMSGGMVQPLKIIDRSQIIHIIDSVRTLILEWALNLEKNGILGEGMSFSQDEKVRAIAPTLNIQNYIENVRDSNIIQGSKKANQYNMADGKPITPEVINDLLQKLRKELVREDFSETVKTDLQAELNTIEAQMACSKPKMLLVKECFQSVRNICEGTTGSLIAAGIVEHISKLFP